MTADEIMELTLAQTNIPYVEGKYYGTEEKYIVYNESDQIPYLYADNAPEKQKTFYQVHYFCPLQPAAGDDSRKVTKKIRKALVQHDFCVTGTIRRTEEKKRHIIIECNLITENEESEEI